MPARHIPHKQGGKVKASFILVCEGLEYLTPQRAAQIIERVLDTDGHDFTEYAALVQHGPRAGAGDVLDLLRESRADLPPGVAQFVTLDEVGRRLEEKYEHEKLKHRKPGTTSYTPPTLLKQNGCGIVIGSREFLQTNIELYLERTQPLLDQVLKASRRINALVEASKARRFEDKTFFHVPEEGTLTVWGGNFDCLWTKFTRDRFKTEELERRLRAAEGYPDPEVWPQQVPEKDAVDD